MPLFLLDCLVPASLQASSAPALRALLNTLHGIFNRMLAYPNLEKYRHINRASATWQSMVAPYVYPIRLAEWGGFHTVTFASDASTAADRSGQTNEEKGAQTDDKAEGTSQCQGGGHAQCYPARWGQQPPHEIESLDDCRERSSEFVNLLDVAALRVKVAEIEVVRDHLTHTSADGTKTAERLMVEKECQRLLLDLAATTQGIATVAATATPAVAQLARAWDLVRRKLYLSLFRAFIASHEVGSERENEEESSGEKKVTVAAVVKGTSGNAQPNICVNCTSHLLSSLDEVVLLSHPSDTTEGDGTAEEPSSPSSTVAQLFANAESYRQRYNAIFSLFHEHVELLSFTVLSDCLSVVEASRVRGAGLSTEPPAARGATGPSGDGGRRGGNASPLSSAAFSFTQVSTLTSQERRDVRAAVAGRYRKQHRADALQHYVNSTGAPYRKLSAQEQGAGVTYILDIASAMEQVAMLEETQGLVRQSKLEANRLHEKFKQDGDLVYLKTLADEWEDRLEATKKRTGKATVFL